MRPADNLNCRERNQGIYEITKLVLERFCDPPEQQRSDEKDARQETTRLVAIIAFVESLFVTRSHAQLLEVGLGFSYVTSALRTVFNQDQLGISALEHPDVPLLSRNDFRKHLIETGVSLRTADIAMLPLPYDDGSFDAIVFSETIEHLSPTLVPALLQDMARLLKPNGIAIISTPNMAAWRYRWKLMRGKTIFDPAIPVDFAGGGVFAHIRLYTAKEVQFLIERAGLNVAEIRYINYGIENNRFVKKLALRIFYYLFPSLSPEFFIVGQKD